MRSAKQIMADVKAQHAKEDAQEALDAAWPAPEARNVPVALEDPRVPSAARAMARRAKAYRLTYSRGPKSARTDVGYRVVDVLVLRAIAGQRKLVAIWMEDKFHKAFAHGVEGSVSAALAKKYLTDDDVDVPWLPDYARLPRH